MKSIFDKVSIDCSRKVTKTYSTSFSLAVKMLGTRVQDPIYAIYGFVRFADEIVDSFHGYDKETLLNEFEEALHRSLERKISLNPILNAFQHVVHEYGIEQDMIDAFLRSMRADLHKSVYTEVEDYNDYIYGSADVVGLMCLKVFVGGNIELYNALKPQAMHLGSAFQKVNFLRDFKSDKEVLNRSYFPNLISETLTADAKQEIITEIEGDFKEALKGIKGLPRDVQLGVYTAYIYYSKLFSQLHKTDAENILKTRIRVSDPAKVGLLVKSFLTYKLKLI